MAGPGCRNDLGAAVTDVGAGFGTRVLAMTVVIVMGMR
jgi:hypothetical protein